MPHLIAGVIKTAFHDGNPVVDLDRDGDKDIVFIGYGNAQNFLIYENLAVSGSVNVVSAAVQKQNGLKKYPHVWVPGEFLSGSRLFDLQGKVHQGVPVKVNNILLVK
jgi:hypothetical protein